MARNSPSCWRTRPQRSSCSKMSRLAIATAADTGWPPNVSPWVNMLVPEEKGSKTLSEAITAPIGAYAEVMPFAVVIRSGW